MTMGMDELLAALAEVGIGPAKPTDPAVIPGMDYELEEELGIGPQQLRIDDPDKFYRSLGMTPPDEQQGSLF